MSYHVQHSSQQKSLGILVVVAFHAVLIFALIAGLKVGITPNVPDSITVETIQEKPTQVAPVDITPINIESRTTINVEPIEQQTFESDPVSDARRPVIPGTSGTVVQTTMSKPKLQNATTPAYPAASARMEEEGTTRLNLYITADGRVSEATVVSSSGYSRLDDAAVKHALRFWRFAPCVDNGTAVGCWHQTNLVWKLENAKR